MRLLSLSVVGLLAEAGAIELLTRLIAPVLDFFHVSEVFILPALTKCLAGGTAYFGVVSDLLHRGLMTAQQVNASAGFMVQTLDLPGIGIYLGIASRFVRLFRFALPGALVGILLRTVLHSTMF